MSYLEWVKRQIRLLRLSNVIRFPVEKRLEQRGFPQIDIKIMKPDKFSISILKTFNDQSAQRKNKKQEKQHNIGKQHQFADAVTEILIAFLQRHETVGYCARLRHWHTR